MQGLATLVLLASSAIAAKVCFVPSFEKFTLTFDKKKMEGDTQVLCYLVEFAEKPTNADLYKDVNCDKDYYVLTTQLLEGSYNDITFPKNNSGPDSPFKPRLIPDTKQYEVDGVKGKLRALAVTPQKVELNQEVKFDGLFCVQKAEKFDTQDPLKLIKFVASSDLNNTILPFQPSSSNSPAPPPASSNNNNVNNNNPNSSNNQSGVGVVRVCTGNNIDCSVSTATSSPSTQSSSNAVVQTSGQGSAIIISTSQPGEAFTSISVQSSG